MSIEIMGETDPTLQTFADQLVAYAEANPHVEIQLYRHTPYSVRIRVIDPNFRGKTKSMRHREVWPTLYELPEDILNELSVLILVTPEEKDSSMSSREFDDPIPSTM